MDSLLQACRENFGPAPRSIPFRDRRYFYPAMPELNASDQLNPLEQARSVLFKRGRLVWSALVRTTDSVFEPGEKNPSAVLIWSATPTWPTDPLTARVTAQEIRALTKGSHTSEFMQIGRLVKSIMPRPFNHELPPSLGPRLFLTSTILFRSQLPCGFLTTDLLPLLVLPEETPYSLILPGRFWPDELKDS